VIFLYKKKQYTGRTATDIVRAIQLDSSDHSSEDSIKMFLSRSLEKLADKVPQRELDISFDLSDEAVAFNYLWLLDTYDGGQLVE
jgi:hypothetical protein